MVTCDGIAALLLVAVAATAALHLLALAQVFIVALGIATVFVWFDAANFRRTARPRRPYPATGRSQPHRILEYARGPDRANVRCRVADRCPILRVGGGSFCLYELVYVMVTATGIRSGRC